MFVLILYGCVFLFFCSFFLRFQVETARVYIKTFVVEENRLHSMTRLSHFFKIDF